MDLASWLQDLRRQVDTPSLVATVDRAIEDVERRRVETEKRATKR